VNVSYQFDQSPYVLRAINGPDPRSSLGALLTGLMVLLFLRDWRSALVVVVTIPFPCSSRRSDSGVGPDHQHHEPGRSRAGVGVLVDEGTVTIENIHTHLARGERVAQAALSGTEETAGPTLLPC